MALIERVELSLMKMVLLLIEHREEEVSLLRMIVSSLVLLYFIVTLGLIPHLSPFYSDDDANDGRALRIIAFLRRSCGPVDFLA
jgi:hypothetical protein